MTMLRQFTLLLLSSTQVAVVVRAQTQCSLCLGGAEANLTKTIGGTTNDPSCSALASDVEIDEDGCRDLQILGYRWCDCPDYPEDYFCPMCKDAFTDIPNRFKEIPGTSGKTCEDKLFVPKGSVGSCLEAMKPGYVCGCPEADEPYCTICGGSVEDDTKMTKPDALLTINTVGSYSCKELVDEAMLGNLSMDQCGLVQAEAFEVCGCLGTNPNAGLDTTTDESNTTEVPLETDEVQSAASDDSSATSTRARQQCAVMTTFLGALVSQLV